MEITIQGKLSEKQSRVLRDLAAAINAHLPAIDRHSNPRVLWDFLCSVLDTLERRRHNRIIGVETTHKDLQQIWEERNA